MPKTRRGFTLIELMIVIAIIAILSAIAISSFSVLQQRSRNTQRQSNLKVIQSALEQYHADQTFYPNNLSGGGSYQAGVIPTGIPLTNQIGNPNGPTPVKTYLQEMPKEPKLGTTGFNNYYYKCDNGTITPTPTLCRNYCLYAVTENLSDIPATCSAPTGYTYGVTGP